MPGTSISIVKTPQHDICHWKGNKHTFLEAPGNAPAVELISQVLFHGYNLWFRSKSDIVCVVWCMDSPSRHKNNPICVNQNYNFGQLLPDLDHCAGPDLARGPPVWDPCFRPCFMKIYAKGRLKGRETSWRPRENTAKDRMHQAFEPQMIQLVVASGTACPERIRGRQVSSGYIKVALQ